MKLQHIGQDFSTKIELNLFPGIKLPRGYYQMNIQYLTDVGGITTFHHMAQNCNHDDLDVIIGRDVRSIDVNFHCHNSFPTNPLIHYRYNMRIDQLFLLNLAIKLLK